MDTCFRCSSRRSRMPFGLFTAVVLLLARPAAGGEEFKRVDSNCDGTFGIADGIFTLGWLFLREEVPCCLDAADANDDGEIDVGDAVFALGFFFGRGVEPSLPFPACGGDPTADDLGCAAYPPCRPANLAPEITEWPVPWSGSRPRDPYVDREGRVWFVGQQEDYAAFLEPGKGEFTRFNLPAGAGPHNLIVGDYVWYAGNSDAHIGRLDPKDGEVVIHPMPDPAAQDPHTLVFDRAGDIWFTVQLGNFVGKLTTATGAVRLIEVPTGDARPYGIAVDSADVPWFVEFGTNKLGRVDRSTMEIHEITLPRSGARPRRLGVASDDTIWYVDYAGGFLGRFDPASGGVTEWRTPGGGASRPYGMAIDDRDRVWFVESGLSPNRFVGFDPRTEEFFGAVNIQSGGGTVRHMFFDGVSRAVWFGTDTGTIGRALLD